jgi:hypothetical protein
MEHYVISLEAENAELVKEVTNLRLELRRYRRLVSILDSQQQHTD